MGEENKRKETKKKWINGEPRTGPRGEKDDAERPKLVKKARIEEQ
jgi:hypothetical protein